MHETQRCRITQRLADKAHLGDRRHIIMRDSARPKLPQKFGRRIGLHGIHRRARKLLDKEAGSTASGVRTDKRDRLNRTKGSSYPQRAMKRVQLKGPPTRSEEHTSELKSIMRTSYAVLCLQKK